jgi:hypothetical protein
MLEEILEGRKAEFGAYKFFADYRCSVSRKRIFRFIDLCLDAEIILKRSLIQQRAWLKSFHTARDAWRKIDDLREINPIDRGTQQTLITDHFRIDRA